MPAWHWMAGRFARAASEFADAAITYLAEQVGAAVADLADYDWIGRSGRRHRAEILAHLGRLQLAPEYHLAASPTPWT